MQKNIFLNVIFIFLFSSLSCKNFTKVENNRSDILKDHEKKRSSKNTLAGQDLFFSHAKNLFSHLEEFSVLDLTEDKEKANFLYFSLILNEEHQFFERLKDHLYENQLILRLSDKNIILLNVISKDQESYNLAARSFKSLSRLFDSSSSSAKSLPSKIDRSLFKKAIQKYDTNTNLPHRRTVGFEDGDNNISTIRIDQTDFKVSHQLNADFKRTIDDIIIDRKSISFNKPSISDTVTLFYNQIKDFKSLENIDETTLKKRILESFETRVQTNDGYVPIIFKRSNKEYNPRQLVDGENHTKLSVNKEGLIRCETIRTYEMLKVGETDSLGQFTAKRTMTFNLKTGEMSDEVLGMKLSDQLKKNTFKKFDYKIPAAIGAAALSSLTAFYLSGLFDTKEEEKVDNDENINEDSQEIKTSNIKPYQATLVLDKEERAEVISFKTGEKIEGLVMVLKKGIYPNLELFNIEN